MAHAEGTPILPSAHAVAGGDGASRTTFRRKLGDTDPTSRARSSSTRPNIRCTESTFNNTLPSSPSSRTVRTVLLGGLEVVLTQALADDGLGRHHQARRPGSCDRSGGGGRGTPRAAARGSLYDGEIQRVVDP
jgi:hypothetical protein